MENKGVKECSQHSSFLSGSYFHGYIHFVTNHFVTNQWHVDDFYTFLYLCYTSIKKATNKQHR